MGRMIDGEWTTEWYEPDEEGRFQRPETRFRDRVAADGSTRFAPEAGRYHLYVSYACPWAHRALIVRELMGLQDAIDVSVVHPYMGEGGWSFADDFAGATGDRLLGKAFMREVYSEADAHYTGRVTVPVLWDRETQTIVNNESAEIIRMLASEFQEVGTTDVGLYPEALRDEIDLVSEAIYEPVNNGVYRAGFAESQKAYEEAVGELFEALDALEAKLAGQRYLCGDRLTLADIHLFTTLVRFDPVYHVHFKCSLRRIEDYANLMGFTRDVYQTGGVAGTVDVDHIKHHYYCSHPMVNPKGLIAVGPDWSLAAPHGREGIGEG